MRAQMHFNTELVLPKLCVFSKITGFLNEQAALSIYMYNRASTSYFFPTFSYFFKIFLFIPIFAPKFLFFPIFSLIRNKT